MPTILIVDDQSEVLYLAQEMLQSAGYHTMATGSGEEALQVLSEHTDLIDLVITDYSMPGMDGADLAGKIEALHPKTRIIIVSGFGQTLKIDSSRIDVFDKPLDFGLLLKKIRKSIG